MSFNGVITSLAILALVADSLVVLTLIALVVTRFSPGGRAAWARLRVLLAPVAPTLAWVVGTVSTLGSLYLSEIAGYLPCKLCWFQRICMYPQVLLLGVAALRGDLPGARRYARPLAAVGAVIAIYHYQLERIPNEPSLTCSLELPCSEALVNMWGFVSIPFMALAGFLLIVTLLSVARHETAEDAESAEAA